MPRTECPSCKSICVVGHDAGTARCPTCRSVFVIPEVKPVEDQGTPWFYGFVEACAYLGIVFSVLFGMCFGFLGILATRTIGETAALGYMLSAAVYTAAGVFSCALALVFCDIGRNLRQRD